MPAFEIQFSLGQNHLKNTIQTHKNVSQFHHKTIVIVREVWLDQL
jgi:hypothetical protein